MQTAFLIVTIATLLLAAALIWLTARFIRQYKQNDDKAHRQKVVASLLGLFILIVQYAMFFTIYRILIATGLV